MSADLKLMATAVTFAVGGGGIYAAMYRLYENRIAGLKEQIAAKQDKVEELQQELGRVRRHAEEARAGEDDLTKQVETLTGEISRVKEELKELSEDVERNSLRRGRLQSGGRAFASFLLIAVVVGVPAYVALRPRAGRWVTVGAPPPRGMSEPGNDGGAGSIETLLVASEIGDMDAVRSLVEQGADVNAATDDGWTALHGAAEHGHLEVVRYLLDQGADVGATTREGKTALHVAKSNEMRELLEAHGATAREQPREEPEAE